MKEAVEERSIYDRIFEKYKNSLLIQLALVAFGVFIWVCFCILPARKYAPIAREDAETYAGYFEEVQTENAESRIVFSDGSTYPLDPATETEELTDALNELEKGTAISLTVNPKTGSVIEIRTGETELLNFDASQAAIYGRHNDSDKRWIGWMFLVLPIVAFLFIRIELFAERQEEDRQERRDVQELYYRRRGVDSPIQRIADTKRKGRTLASAKIRKYNVVYRRLGRMNELIVNGIVYDEKKALFEVAHKLCCTIDGHRIEAGYDARLRESYISFDDEIVSEKNRLI